MNYIKVKNQLGWTYYIPKENYILNEKLFKDGHYFLDTIKHLLHRLNGPSIEFSDKRVYFIKGKEYPYFQWLTQCEIYKHNIEFNNKFNNLIGND